MRNFVVASLAVLLCGCSAVFDNSRYYMPDFNPTSIVVELCPYESVRVNQSLDWVVIVNAPKHVSGCGPRRESFVGVSGGRSIAPNWHAIDGGFGMAGTFYSLRTLWPDQREEEHRNRKPDPNGVYFVPDEIEDLGSFVSNGLVWEHHLVREFTKYPEGGGNVPGVVRPTRIKDVYVYKHPEGWWLRVQATFNVKMKEHPHVLQSRRQTLREVVNSVNIERKDPSRITCTTDDKNRRSCRYHLPQQQTPSRAITGF